MPAVSVCFNGGTGIFLNRANPAGGAANIRASHTIMGRVKFTATTSGERYDPFAYDDNSDFSGTYFGKATGTTTVCKGGRQNTTPTFQGVTPGGTTVDTTTWRHFAVVYDSAAALITYYIDGVSIGTQASATTYVSSAAGTDLTIYAAIARAKMADYAVFNRALSAGEVADMADYRVCQVTSGLIGFWRFDANANDSSGNANHFTNAGSGTAITYSTADPPPQPENPVFAVAGALATSSAFSGTLSVPKPLASTLASSSAFAGDLKTAKPIAATLATSSALSAWIRPRWGRRVTVTGSSVLTLSGTTISTTAAWTICSWVRILDPVAGRGRFQMDGSGPSARLAILGNTPVYDLRFVDNVGTVAISYNAAADTNWHHLALTYDGTTVRAYVDAVQVASGAATNAGNFTSLFYDASSAQISEFAHTKIWQAELSAAQLSSEATYFTPHVANAQLYAWWQLSWQNVTLDSSGNGHTLTDSGSTEAQSESPGLPLFLLAGALASSSSFSPALGATRELSGALASSSAFAGAAKQLQVLAGTLATSSALAGNLTQAVPVAGTMATSSAFSVALAQAQVLAGTLASTSSFAAGALVQAQALAGALASSSALSGVVGVTRELVGTLASSSAFAGTAKQLQALTGVLQTDSAFDGLASVPGNYNGFMATSSAFSASLVLDQPLLGTLGTTSSFAGMTQALIAATMVTDSTFGGAIGGLRGALQTDSAFAQAVLSLSTALSGTMASSSAFSGIVQALLAGQLLTGSAFSGALIQSQVLAVVLSTSSAFSGALSGGIPVAGGAGGDPSRDRVGMAAGYGRRRIR